MTHPKDLDEFSRDQIQLTEGLESGKITADILIKAASAVTAAGIMATMTFPMEVWERACYEAACRSGDGPDMRGYRDALWAVIQFKRAISRVGQQLFTAGVMDEQLGEDSDILKKIREALGEDE